MNNKKLIDFLIIGAQKSATTSLFKYLSVHPDIYMPREKETNFFSDDKKFILGVSWYMCEHFSSASSSMIWGEASPDYMCYDYVPERIYRTFPNIKLIAMLRNPVTRAYSHYRMAVRRKIEALPFDEYIKKLIARSNISDDFIDYAREFIMFGEYGRILSNYLKYFPINKIKLIFMENMIKEPMRNMKDIYSFLGVLNEFESGVFGKQYHKGGEARFIFLEKFLMHKWIKQPLRLLLPPKIRRPLGFWLITKLTVKTKMDSGPSQEIRQILKNYYSKDVELLESLFEIRVPWKEFNKNLV